ncbi:MAG: NADH-quinone oxidoreductase subunit I [Candidatus Melainabacteria bacterium]|jgi:NADH-quinone oxidoreductase subunit I|nr:NADH-quinone oxidoreductase subunit I [Candidatus Melainabacteria bacterium]
MMMMVSEQTQASASLAGKTTTDVIKQSTNSLVVDGLKEITRGLLTVLKQHNTDPITLEYPEVMPELSDRFHGRLSLLSKSDGTDLCIGCQACARVCPCDDLIQIEMHRDADKKPVIDRFTIDLGRCIFCGNCTEVCPVDCIKFLPDFELADYSREALVLDKKDLTLNGEESDQWRKEHGLAVTVA